MSDPILTPEQVAALKTLWRQPVRAGAAAGELELPDDMRRACDSHEALRTERDAARRETEALRPVVEAALVLVEEWPLRATPNGGEIGLAVAVRAYRAALASLPSSSTPSEEGPTP